MRAPQLRDASRRPVSNYHTALPIPTSSPGYDQTVSARTNKFRPRWDAGPDVSSMLWIWEPLLQRVQASVRAHKNVYGQQCSPKPALGPRAMAKFCPPRLSRPCRRHDACTCPRAPFLSLLSLHALPLTNNTTSVHLRNNIRLKRNAVPADPAENGARDRQRRILMASPWDPSSPTPLRRRP